MSLAVKVSIFALPVDENEGFFPFFCSSYLRIYGKVNTRLENSAYFCDSPKNACGIQMKGLERVLACEARAIRTRQSTLSALRALQAVI